MVMRNYIHGMPKMAIAQSAMESWKWLRAFLLWQINEWNMGKVKMLGAQVGDIIGGQLYHYTVLLHSYLSVATKQMN